VASAVSAMLEIEQLRFAWDDTKATGMCFDLAVEDGEVLSLIGPSGAGKSTLLHLVAGFLTASAGSIRVDGEPIERLDCAQRPVSIVFQQHNLFPHLDLYTNVALGVTPSLDLSAAQRAAVRAAFERLGIDGLERRKPGQVSGGQRQRVALARALVRERKLLLLDEAFAALGPALRTELIGLVAELVRERGFCALLVSHQPQDALLASKRCAFIDAGRVAALQPTAQLLEQPELDAVRAYLGST